MSLSPEEALRVYANPNSWWAVFLQGDAPCGYLPYDWGPVAWDHDDHDHRPGHQARLALGGEQVAENNYDYSWWKIIDLQDGCESCETIRQFQEEKTLNDFIY